jgi:hypothetical protein
LKVEPNIGGLPEGLKNETKNIRRSSFLSFSSFYIKPIYQNGKLLGCGWLEKKRKDMMVEGKWHCCFQWKGLL